MSLAVDSLDLRAKAYTVQNRKLKIGQQSEKVGAFKYRSKIKEDFAAQEQGQHLVYEK